MDPKIKRLLIVDMVALVVYLVVANPVFTSIAVHEWLGLAVFVVFVVHCAQHADWVVETLRTLFRNPTPARIGHFVVDALLVVAFMICTVSGLLISGAVLPTFGLFAEGYFFWDPLHAASATLLLALLLIHVVVHWRWIARLFRKGPGKGLSNGLGEGSSKGSSDLSKHRDA